MNGAKKAASLGLLALTLFLAGLLFNFSERETRKVSAVPPAAAPKNAFHVREELKPPPDTGCASCHKGAPHEKNRSVRAFLNLHTGKLACQVCHADSQGMTYAKMGEGEKAQVMALIGGRPIAAPSVAGVIHTFAEGASFRPSGPPCNSCHARNGKIVSVPGLYDDYRRRLIEELDVLPLLEQGR